MGQIVEVVERLSSRPGIVRFETNRVLSGMGHERYVAGQLIEGDRPVDELARRLFARGGIASVHINSGVVTVDLEKGYTSDGLADLIRGLYTFYEPSAEARPDAVAAAAAVEAAPDAEAAAGAPVLQGIAEATSAGVPAAPTAGDEAAARNEAIAAKAAEAAPPGDSSAG
jgi:hypothetical protein